MAKRNKILNKKEPWQRARRTSVALALPAPAPVTPTPPAELIAATPVVDLDRATDEDICRVLRAIIFFDPGRLIRTDGTTVELKEVDYWTRLAVCGLELSEFYGRDEGAQRTALGLIKKFRLADRFKAMELLWRYEGKLSEDADHRRPAADLMPPAVQVNFVAVKVTPTVQ